MIKWNVNDVHFFRNFLEKGIDKKVREMNYGMKRASLIFVSVVKISPAEFCIIVVTAQ